jgi:hypothetical protein
MLFYAMIPDAVFASGRPPTEFSAEEILPQGSSHLGAGVMGLMNWWMKWWIGMGFMII